MLHCTKPDVTDAAVEKETARVPALIATLDCEGYTPVQVAAEVDERLNPDKPDIITLAIATEGSKRYWNEKTSDEAFPFTESVRMIEGEESLLYATVKEVVAESIGKPLDEKVITLTAALIIS
jgi:hypothetical protein